MKLYQLLWTLLKHGIHGRFREEVHASVLLDSPDRSLGLVGPVVDFDFLRREEGFFIINAVSEDPGPWCEHPSIEELIEASSLGTPEAKALRASVPDAQVDRIMARVREIDRELPFRSSRYRETQVAPDVWIDDPLPGGYVCGAADPSKLGGVCGMPVEDEPCAIHQPQGPIRP